MHQAEPDVAIYDIIAPESCTFGDPNAFFVWHTGSEVFVCGFFPIRSSDIADITGTEILNYKGGFPSGLVFSNVLIHLQILFSLHPSLIALLAFFSIEGSEELGDTFVSPMSLDSIPSSDMHSQHSIMSSRDSVATTEKSLGENKDGTFANEETINAEVSRLARELTRQSNVTVRSSTENPFFSDDKDSSLNPNSPNFDPRSWIKSLLSIQSRDPKKYPERKTGVVFKDLSVYGFGSPTDYQKDVLNCLLEFGTIFRRLVGIKMKKIQILHGFDGLVKSGEMLIVLGRPGSGCSTFLKTVAGEMNGIQIDENSFIHYNGKLTSVLALMNMTNN